MDVQQGMLCGITSAPAAFEGTCPDFIRGESAKERIHSSNEPLKGPEVAEVIPDRIVTYFRAEQNLSKGILAASLAGLLGAILWAVITVVTNFQIGFMAVAIGALVGFSMRKAGQGIDQVFGIAGATIALVSCLLGNFFSIVGYIANYEGIGYLETLTLLDYSQVPAIMGETFSLIDLVFYGIALAEGYKFSFRAISEEDLAAAQEDLA